MVVRFGISLDKDLVERFDREIKSMGYFNRSKALADAINLFLTQKKLKKGSGKIYGTFSYLYDHHAGKLTQKLTEIQHDFGNIILSTMHLHLSHTECIEVMVVRGNYEKIKKMVNLVSGMRGVKNSGFSVLL